MKLKLFKMSALKNIKKTLNTIPLII